MINQIKLAAKFAHKDKNNISSNIAVKDGIIQCHDHLCGVSINSTIELDFCCNAQMLSAVLSKCKDGTDLKINKGKLEIKSGRLKSKIDIMPVSEYPFFAVPEGDIFESENIIDDLKKLSMFTSPDDVRLFAQGVNISNNSLSATNGHTAIKKQVSIDIDKNYIVPTKSIDKIYAAKTPCNKLLFDDNGAVYFASEALNFFTKTITSPMPDIDRVLSDTTDQKTKIDDIKETVLIIRDLCNIDKTVVLGKTIGTRDGSTKIDGFNIPESAFNADYLASICDVADYIDFSKSPDPCPFEAENIQGAIVGIRL